MNTSNNKNSLLPGNSISRRKFFVQVGGAAAFMATAGIPVRQTFAADESAAAPAESPFWYDMPAADWRAAIPIGNGRIGGMILGGIQNEEVLLNESGVWGGRPCPTDNPDGPNLIAQMRELLFAGKPVEAEQICGTFLGKDTDREDRSYQLVGVMHMKHELADSATEYRRWLDYESAIASVRFKQGEVEFLREAFVSAPDQVLVIRLTASQAGKISFAVSCTRQSDSVVTRGERGRTSSAGSFTKESDVAVTATGKDQLHISGQAMDFQGFHKGAKFDVVVRAVAEGGEVSTENDQLTVTNATSVTLFLAVASDYNLRNPDSPLTLDRVSTCEKQIAAAIAKPYAQLRTDHVADFQKLYQLSSLDIGVAVIADQPIDRRIVAAAAGGQDPALLKIYYDYCRYILISASRTGGLPMTLQGIWNPFMKAPWRSNWHLNINLQEAYWFAEQGNLSECHEPLFSLTEELMKHGEATAQVMLGTKRGFSAGHRTDGPLFTRPSPEWPGCAMYVSGGAWCTMHLMEHYRFSQDRDFLANRALPVLRSAALFWLDWLVPNPKTGKLVAGPATSPENAYRLPDGKRASISMGPSHDQEIAWNSLSDYAEACQILGIKNDETREVQAALDQLALPEIAPDGRLREWPEDYMVESNPGHRHLSHLWGMMPGRRITLQKTPELAQAVSKSLDYRLAHNYDAQGWNLGWVTCVLARLKEGDRALDIMTQEYVGKAFSNMFVNAHGNAQVGDMMGVPLAMIELLLQSHAGEIELLPALPAKWTEGKATGLCARGGFIVDMEWKNGELAKAVIHSRADGAGKFRYKEKLVQLVTKAGQSYEIL